MGVIYRSAASSSSSVLDPAASTWKRGVELVWRGPPLSTFWNWSAAAAAAAETSISLFGCGWQNEKFLEFSSPLFSLLL